MIISMPPNTAPTSTTLTECLVLPHKKLGRPMIPEQLKLPINSVLIPYTVFIFWVCLLRFLGRNTKLTKAELKQFRGRTAGWPNEFELVVKDTKPGNALVRCLYAEDGQHRSARNRLYSHGYLDVLNLTSRIKRVYVSNPLPSWVDGVDGVDVIRYTNHQMQEVIKFNLNKLRRGQFKREYQGEAVEEIELQMAYLEATAEAEEIRGEQLGHSDYWPRLEEWKRKNKVKQSPDEDDD